jgi:hypothetical protein
MKITTLIRSIPVSSATINMSTFVVTVNTTGNHLLATGDGIRLNAQQPKSFSVTVTSATQFTYTYSDPGSIPNINNLPTTVYSASLVSGGATSDVISCGAVSDSTKTFQAVGSTTAGTGSGVVVIEVSNDGATFLSAGTITLTLGTTATTDGFALAAPWAYVRANCTSVSGTGAKVKVLMGSVS